MFLPTNNVFLILPFSPEKSPPNNLSVTIRPNNVPND